MSWLEARRAEFALWRKANPQTQPRIVRLKARTMQMVQNRVAGKVEDPPVVFRVIGALTHVWDIPVAPRLTVIPAGEFTMGSPGGEPDRQPVEGPQHRVVIPYPLAVGSYMVTRDEYAAFVADTGRPDPDGCWLTFRQDKAETKGFNWHNPGFEQTGSDPVVCVSWEDGRDYAAWLAEKTGERYRLLSEAEWEFASRGGTATARPWGDGISHDDANFRSGPGTPVTAADVWEFTAPSGSFPPNPFGLYDVLGNAWQRLDDCWNASFAGAPADGSVWKSGDCTLRTGHGGAFDSPPIYLRSAFRGKVPVDMHYADGGFRVAREL